MKDLEKKVIQILMRKKKIKKIIVSHDHEGELKNDSEVHFFFLRGISKV